MDHPSILSFIFHLFSFVQAGYPSDPQVSLNFYTIVIQTGLILIGLLLSALFSGSEVAFFSLTNQKDLLSDIDNPNSRDNIILKLLERPRRLLATILIGNTFANIITSVLAAVITGDIVAYLGLSEVLVYLIEILIVTFMILIMSEITPKIIAINNPLKAARRLSKFIYYVHSLLKPLTILIANSTMSLEESLPKPSSKMSSEDIMTMAEVSEREGSIKSDEREIIENVIEFGNIMVREIMTSRVNIVAISMDQSLDEVLSLIRERGISRMPIYENDLDNILGVIHSKDVLPYINSDIERSTINWRTIARNTLFIPSTKKLDDLLRDFQQEKTHIALVVDEYGGTEGLITLDDILEEIVGDITDEYDELEEQLFTRFKSGVYIFDAKIDLDDMEEVLDITLTSEDDDFETLGGLIYYLTERIPNVGERVYYQNVEFTIHSVMNNRVKKLRVKVQDKPPKGSKKHHKAKDNL